MTQNDNRTNTVALQQEKSDSYNAPDKANDDTVYHQQIHNYIDAQKSSYRHNTLDLIALSAIPLF